MTFRFIACLKYAYVERERGDVVVDLTSRRQEDAIEEVKNIIIGKWIPEREGFYERGYWYDYKLIGAQLFEIVDRKELPVDRWYAEADDFKKQYRKNIQEKKERAEYERLKAKFEAKGD